MGFAAEPRVEFMIRRTAEMVARLMGQTHRKPCKTYILMSEETAIETYMPDIVQQESMSITGVAIPQDIVMNLRKDTGKAGN